MKALFSIFSLTALLLQFAGSPRGDNFKASLSPLLIVRAQNWQMENLFVRKNSQIWWKHNFTLTMGQVSVSHPRPVPLLKNSIEEISFFPRRKYRGNIFFHREKISGKYLGKYCPQSPIIGPFANLFSHGSVFAQSTKGGEEKRVVVGIPKII